LSRLHILVEGQTEETVARDVLEPHLRTHGWFVSYSIVKTKRPAGGPAHKGGVTSWRQLDREITLLLRNSSFDVITTLLDYYAFHEQLGSLFGTELAATLRADIAASGGSEEINDHPETAPSKRLARTALATGRRRMGRLPSLTSASIVCVRSVRTLIPGFAAWVVNAGTYPAV
jgi:hypothetical protein